MLTLGTYGADANFFKLKGELENILSGLRLPKASYCAVKDNPSYHPGRCAAVSMNGILLGYMGQIHPLVAKNYGLDCEVYCLELDFAKMSALVLPEPVYVPLPKFPSVTRDIAVVCDEAVTVGALEAAIRKGGKSLLKDVALFDIYRGKGVAEGKKSVAFNLTLRADDRSLTGEEADADVKAVLESLEKECGAVLR